MLEDNLVSCINLASCDVLSDAGAGLNSPHGVVSLFVIHADFLVAGVASESHGGKGQRVKVEFSFAKVSARADSHILPISNATVCACVCVLNFEDGARAGSIIFAGGSDGV